MESKKIKLSIKNIQTNDIIELEAEVCNNTFSRARGLMFRKRHVNLFFVFDEEKIYPIHSYFVFFEFDAIYIQSNGRIVEIYKNVKPNSFINPKEKANYLLEAYSGFSEKNNINIGDVVETITKQENKNE
ncbi:MAG: DUF192 domain-containing protein [Candidatus Micrarchaeota archaeon]|nr:DUF192 domain-containing protein [Candidatus Micrarchaeota archaeon]